MKTSPQDPLNILLVDDLPTNLAAYEAILSELGENLIKARSAQAALAQLMKTEIALIVTDVSMPEMDGFQLAAMLREHPRFEKTPVIFVSASQLTDHDRLKGFEAGAVDYITAPVVPELLRAKVKVFTDLCRKTRQLEQLNAEAQRKSEALAAGLYAAALDAVITIDERGMIVEWNHAAEKVFGYSRSAALGREMAEMIVPPRLREAHRRGIAHCLQHGDRPVLGRLMELPALRADGTEVPVELYVVRMPVRGPPLFTGVVRDITERKRAEEHVRLLMRELSHRTKNVMAVVQAIAFQTVRKSGNLKNFEEIFMERLEALGRSHDLLLKRDWTGVVLEDLVRAQLQPFLDSARERIAAHGPAVLLIPLAAQDLGMALHELATNASKYGALSRPAGKIEVSWTIDDGAASERRFRITWRETGGPEVRPPVHKGFGTTVITRALSNTFKGIAEVEYRAEGLFWELAAPLGDLIMELPSSRRGTRTW